MPDSPVSPKRGLFQSLSKRVSEYRHKRKGDQHPSAPGSQVSETESQRSADDPDHLEVQVSGKSARSARRLTSRQGLTHLASAPAGALQAAAEQAVADHLEDSTHPKTAEDWSFHSTAFPQKPTPRFNRSQSHMDLPKQGSKAISPHSVALAMDSMVSSSSSNGTTIPIVSAQSSGPHHVSPFDNTPSTLVSPAAAPEVQQDTVQPSVAQSIVQQGTNSSGLEGRRLSRKISGNKIILSTEINMEAKNGEILLPPQAAPFAGRGGFDNLEICFSGKSARMSRGALRRTETIAAH